ncbi:MAG: NfeD family protein [Sarcina sp.]
MEVVWILLISICAILDIVILDFLFSGISIAALVSLILSLFGANEIIQFIFFVVISFIGIFCIYPILVKKIYNTK